MSAHSVRIEAGLSHMADQVDKKAKVQQVIGETTMSFMK